MSGRENSADPAGFRHYQEGAILNQYDNSTDDEDEQAVGINRRIDIGSLNTKLLN